MATGQPTTDTAVKCGNDLGAHANQQTHALEKGSVQHFNDQLHAIQKNDPHHQLEHIADRRATASLVSKHILPSCVLVASEKEKCNLAGTTANKSGEKDLVLALGKNAHGRAHHVVVMDESGKYFTAKKEGERGYVKGEAIGNKEAFETYCKNEIKDSLTKKSDTPTTDGLGKITVTGDQKNPTALDISHGSGARTPDRHFKKEANQWLELNDKGDHVNGRKITSLSIDDKGQPTVSYDGVLANHTGGYTVTYLRTNRELTKDDAGRPTSVTAADGRAVKLGYSENGSVNNYIVRAANGESHHFAKIENQNLYTEDGSGDIYNCTNPPNVNLQTGEVNIHQYKDGEDSTITYT